MTGRQALARPEPPRAASVYDGMRLAGTVEITKRGYEARDADGRWIGVFPVRLEVVRAVLRSAVPLPREISRQP